MKILVFNLSNVGDVILTTAIIEPLRRKFRSAIIDVFLGSRAESVFISDPRIRRVITYDKKLKFSEKFSLFRRLRRERYDLVFDLRNSLISYFLGRRVYRSKGVKGHRYLKHNSVLRKFYSQEELREFYPKIFWSSEDKTYIDSLELENFILISPIARSWTKTWPQEYFKELIDLIREKYPELKIVLVGENSEYKYCSRLVRDENVINLAGKTNIPQLGYLLSKSKLVITNDSAVLHLASTINTPTLAIFGPTDEKKYGPLAEGSFLLRRYFPCAPCERAQCIYGDKRCLVNIRPEELFKFVTKILNSEKIYFRIDYKRILLTRTDKIGDLILTTPVIEVMRKNFPNAYLSFLLNIETQDILKNNPYLDEVLVLDKKRAHKGLLGFLKILSQIRKSKFDLVVNFHPNNRVHLLSFFAFIPKRIGYDWKMGWLNNIVIKHQKQLGEKSEAEYNFELLKPLGINEISFRQTLLPSQSALKWLKKEMEDFDFEEFVVIHPGAACKSKLWPLENFISLAEKVIRDYNFKIIFVLGPKETEMRGEIESRMNKKVLIYNNLELEKLIALISKATLMLSNDSGPMHIADAFSRPLIVIFGRKERGLSAKRWGPLSKNAIVIQKDVGCKQCLAHNCRKDFLCLKEITPDEVYPRVEEILKLIKKK